MTSSKSASAGVQRASWLLLLLGVLASAALIGRSKPAASSGRHAVDVIAAVPPGPALLVTVDLAALPPRVVSELLRAGAGSLLGVRALCGFEPLLTFERLVLAMPVSPAGQNPDFALIAATSLRPEPALRCAEAVIRKRGGAPVRSRSATFDTVRDQARPLGVIAIRNDGLLVLSGGDYFQAVVAAATGTSVADEAARVRNEVHARVRRELGQNQLLLSALGESWLPLTGVQALGAGLELGRDVQLRGALYCASTAACHDARELLGRVLADTSREPGLASLSDATFVERSTELRLYARLPTEALVLALSRLLQP